MWLELILQAETELVLTAAFDGDKDAGPRLAASCLARWRWRPVYLGGWQPISGAVGTRFLEYSQWSC